MLRLVAVASRNSPQAFLRLSESDALARLGVLVPGGGSLVPSLAGLLSVGAYPQQFFPQLMASVAVYPNADPGEPGPDGICFLDSAAAGGPVPAMVGSAVQAVLQNLRRASRVAGVGREDLWEIGPGNGVGHSRQCPPANGSRRVTFL